MHYGAMLVGQFLKAAEFGTGTTPAQPTFTIANVALEKLESVAVGDNDGATGKLKTKGVLYFREVDRGLVLNRTNAECIAAMFGIETNDWIGKRLTLYAAEVRVGPKMDIGIRIKGSPDISRELTVSVKLPRRKPIPMKMVPTGAAQKKNDAPMDSLEADAQAVAECGSEAYKDFFTKLTADQRKSIAHKHEEFKMIAAKADGVAQ